MFSVRHQSAVVFPVFFRVIRKQTEVRWVRSIDPGRRIVTACCHCGHGWCGISVTKSGDLGSGTKPQSLWTTLPLIPIFGVFCQARIAAKHAWIEISCCLWIGCEIGSDAIAGKGGGLASSDSPMFGTQGSQGGWDVLPPQSVC